MDFDIGNILYLVVTLVVVIVGLLGRKKKTGRKAVPGDGKKGPAKPSFMENLEKVLTMGQEVPEVMDIPENEPDILSEEVVKEAEAEPVTGEPVPSGAGMASSLMEEYSRVIGRIAEPAGELIQTETDIITEPIEVIHLDEEEGTDYFEIVKDFDAGTAVVYSAIINRVDY
jgi:hypothetical protein